MFEEHKSHKALAEILAALHETNHLLREVVKELHHLPPAALQFTAIRLLDGSVKRNAMDITLSNPLQKVTDTVSAIDANGTTVPAVYDSPPVWTSSDAGVATVVAADDGLSAVVSAVAEGTALISVAASVGGSPLIPGTQTVTVSIAPGPPVALVITAGTPS